MDFSGCTGCGGQAINPDGSSVSFVHWETSPTAVLPSYCNLLSGFDVFIEYTWPPSQRDLDTGTNYVGLSVGYACGFSTAYMMWSGDDVSAGGSERINVDVYKSWQAGLWSTVTDVVLRAGWYIPARGTGQATVTASLRDRRSTFGAPVLVGSVQKSIQPGAQSACASTVVGNVRASLEGPPGNGTIRITLT